MWSSLVTLGRLFAQRKWSYTPEQLLRCSLWPTCQPLSHKGRLTDINKRMPPPPLTCQSLRLTTKQSCSSVWVVNKRESKWSNRSSGARHRLSTSLCFHPLTRAPCPLTQTHTLTKASFRTSRPLLLHLRCCRAPPRLPPSSQLTQGLGEQ